MRTIKFLNSTAATLINVMRLKLLHLLLLALLTFTGYETLGQYPGVTVRFANPEYEYETQTYSMDVEFQCNTEGKQLFGMNVRFFYPDTLLEFIAFGEFAEGYAPMSPNPPLISTGNSSSGMILFGFPGPQEYLNGAIQKSGTSSLLLSTTGWTKIFNVSFHVDDTNSLDIESFCPPVIWDINETETGGIAAGFIITIVNGSGSAPACEHADQFNWQYDGIPGLPHGFPAPLDCISTIEAYIVPIYDTIQNITMPGGTIDCYDALQTIYVAGNGTTVTLESGADVNLIAGMNIFLLPGAFVASGAELLAAITTSGNFCNAFQSSVVSNPLPVDEVIPALMFEGRKFKIYPNPTTGRFTVSLEKPFEEQSLHITISNLMGKTLIRQLLENSDHFNFDLTGQIPGIYIVRLETNSQSETYKLVIN